MRRREFLYGSAVAAAGWNGWSTATAQPQAPEEKRQLESELVNQFVSKSHFDLKGVEELLTKEPALVNAAWDWGSGDWETGLGAASHTGQREIAELILSRQGRIDQFAATMLGFEAVVVSLLDAQPQLHKVPGPHGIPLLSHAVVGQKPTELCRLLLDRGAKVDTPSTAGMTPLMTAASLGSLELLQLLLSAGADPLIVDKRSRTALQWAESKGHEEAANLLRKASGQ